MCPQGLVVALVHDLQSPVQKVLESQTLGSSQDFAATLFVGCTKTDDHSEDLEFSKAHTWNTVSELERQQVFASKGTLEGVAMMARNTQQEHAQRSCRETPALDLPGGGSKNKIQISHRYRAFHEARVEGRDRISTRLIATFHLVGSDDQVCAPLIVERVNVLIVLVLGNEVRPVFH